MHRVGPGDVRAVRRRKKGLPVLILATAVLAAKGTGSKGLMPSVQALVLALDEEQLEGCDRRRWQRRRIRSVGAGSFTLKYQTGRRGAARIRPAGLDAIIAPGMSFAYDVVEETVRLRYVELRQREEIRAELAAKGVRISTGSVSNLSWEGLAGLQCLHFRRAAALAGYYRREAFVLHMDGTREGGHWAQFVVREGLSGHVVAARKIRTEHSADIGEILAQVRTRFGVPDCIVSDMSAAIANAVEDVFPGVPHRLCHYHFLKAVGRVMLGDDHEGLGRAVGRTTGQLRKIRRRLTELLRQHHCLARPAIDLIDHIVSNSAQLKAEGFPFDLPNLHYYTRCERAAAVIERCLHEAVRRYGCGDPAVACMRDLREQVRLMTEHLPHSPVKRLRKRFAQFEDLRDILRPATADSEGRKAPLNWGMLSEHVLPELVDIAGPLQQFRDKARRMAKRKSLGPADRKMWRGLQQRMDNYADKLNPVLEVRGKTIVLPRTNNLSETGFRDFKRRLRRTTGNGNLARQLDHTPAEAFYAENLRCPDYTRIVFDGRTMAEALADVDRCTVRQAVTAMKAPPSPGIIDHSFINRDDFYEAVHHRFAEALAAKAR